MTLAATAEYKEQLFSNAQFKLLLYDTDDTLGFDDPMTLTDEGVKLNWRGSGNEFYVPIMPIEMKATIVVNDANIDALVKLSLITSKLGRFLVEVQHQNKGDGWVPIFKGVVKNNYESLEYNTWPYEYTLTAVCGLQLLKNIEYDQGAVWFNLGSGFSHHRHVINCIHGIPNLVANLYSASDPLIEYAAEWENSNYTYGAGTTTYTQDRFVLSEHFYDILSDGTFRFHNAFEVLTALCERYLLRCRQVNGVFRLEQISTLDSPTVTLDRYLKGFSFDEQITESIIDMDDPDNSYHFVANPFLSIAPPVKHVTVTVKDHPQLNLAYDRTWTEITGSLYNLAPLVDNDASYLTIVIKIDFNTSLNAQAYQTHHYRWRVTIKVGTNYLVQTATFNSQGSYTYSDPEWQGSAGYCYILAWALPESIPGPDGNYVEHTIQSPLILTSADLEVEVERDSLLDETGATIAEGGAPWNVYGYVWLAKMDVRLLDNEGEPQDRKFVGLNDSDNDEIIEFETTFIDTDTTWTDVNGGTEKVLEKVFVDEYLKLRGDPTRVIQGTLTSNGGNDKIKTSKIFFDNTKEFVFNGGTWTTGLTELSGDWFRHDLTKSGAAPTATFTDTDVIPRDEIKAGIRIDVAEALGQTTISITQPGIGYTDGDAVVITELDTGNIHRTTLAADLASTDTEMEISDSLPWAAAAWSLVEITPEPLPSATGYYQLFESITAALVTVTAGTLPDPATNSDTVMRKKVEVWRNGMKMIYVDTGSQTNNLHFSIDVSGANDITFFRTITAKEIIETKFRT